MRSYKFREQCFSIYFINTIQTENVNFVYRIKNIILEYFLI